MRQAGAVVAELAAGEGRLQEGGGVAALAGEDPAVAGITRPAHGAEQLQVVASAYGVAGAFLREFLDFSRTSQTGDEIDHLGGETDVEPVVLGEGDPEVHPAAGKPGGVVRDAQLQPVPLLVAGEEPAADPFRPEVGIGVGDAVLLLAAAVVERERRRVSGAEQVLLGDGHVEERPPVLRVADAQEQRPGRALGDVDDDVHLVVGSRDRLGLDADLAEVSELEQPLPGAVEVAVDDPCALELAHLAPKHLVPGLVVAPELDAPHVYPPAGVDEEDEVHLSVLLANLRRRVHVGERISLVAETGLHVRGRFRHVAPAEDLPLPGLHQGKELFGRDDQVAGELDRADLERPSLGDVDRDVDGALVGGDGNLGGIDREVDVAPIEVVGPKALQISRQLLLRVAVRAGKPGEHGPGRGLEEIDEIVLLERPVADDVDPSDARHVPLVDIEVDAHPVALEGGHRRLDFGGVPALGEIGLADLLDRSVQDGGVERAADREPHPPERFEQVVGLEGLVAGEVDARDGGTLLDHHHEDAVVALDPHVVEEAGREQALDGLRGVLRVHRVADGDRELVEHRADGDPPKALDADVLDHERLGERDGRQDRQQAGRGQPGDESSAHQLKSLMTSL